MYIYIKEIRSHLEIDLGEWKLVYHDKCPESILDRLGEHRTLYISVIYIVALK